MLILISQSSKIDKAGLASGGGNEKTSTIEMNPRGKIFPIHSVNKIKTSLISEHSLILLYSFRQRAILNPLCVAKIVMKNKQSMKR